MSTAAAAATPTFEDFRAGASAVAAGELAGLGTVVDLQVTLSMEVGRTTITVRDLLQLTAGSVVELERGPDEAFDVLVNGTLLARGEPVVVNERCGVRLTDVVQPNERGSFLGR